MLEHVRWLVLQEMTNRLVRIERLGLTQERVGGPPGRLRWRLFEPDVGADSNDEQRQNEGAAHAHGHALARRRRRQVISMPSSAKPTGCMITALQKIIRPCRSVSDTGDSELRGSPLRRTAISS